jgi:flagellar biosynthesis protein FliQ
MSEMSTAHITTILACVVAALAAGYLLIMWLAARAIDEMNGIWHPQRRRVHYQARCSTAPDVSVRQALAIVGSVLLAGVFALLASTWLGQELVEYVARVLLTRGA